MPRFHPVGLVEEQAGKGMQGVIVGLVHGLDAQHALVQTGLLLSEMAFERVLGIGRSDDKDFLGVAQCGARLAQEIGRDIAMA